MFGAKIVDVSVKSIASGYVLTSGNKDRSV